MKRHRTRSVYILSGEARNLWEHSIPQAAALRYSVMFRTLRRESGIRQRSNGSPRLVQKDQLRTVRLAQGNFESVFHELRSGQAMLGRSAILKMKGVRLLRVQSLQAKPVRAVILNRAAKGVHDPAPGFAIVILHPIPVHAIGPLRNVKQ